jgi:hypothetical protein
VVQQGRARALTLLITERCHCPKSPSSDENGDRRKEGKNQDKDRIQTDMMTLIIDQRLCDQDMIVWWVWKTAITAIPSFPSRKRTISSKDEQRPLREKCQNKSCEIMESKHMGRTVRQSSISPSHSQLPLSSPHKPSSTSPVYVAPFLPTPWPKLWHKKQRKFINSARPVNYFGKYHIHSFVIKPEIVTNSFFCQNQNRDVFAIAISSRLRTVVVEQFWFSLDIKLGNLNQNNLQFSIVFSTQLCCPIVKINNICSTISNKTDRNINIFIESSW